MGRVDKKQQPAEERTTPTFGIFMAGANTYICNSPNFMVKAVADQQNAHTPNFLGYVFKFTLPFMLPMLMIIWWLFFRY